ncbi:di-trans,poly-cis-decaprenylcistransferase [Nitrosomonas sp. JL21]|uniref:polyprenyl diphosphate synthase n=1 Tax=Nitrosomonas sp. JL21 TaxID=153949 RepID=UPI00136F3C84|nr:polyprenyl diphosphate synthase [Nitrosomonas sp. JL21]MBL8496619.1 di-trans,poly-cis-decaprenylcistransferase [Nitrosomonas sp.]MCC7092503.1 di-trans,poly-cis-decaprenylcistransferase [Nitrosomonas sp.]MXS76466.1 di-trans,poly-cis-decaprenylcistransferase [Nitrosomonas sp. JL21]
MPQGPSSTREIPEIGSIPRHIAIIMDGNGRWARNRFMPRVAGHQQGVETVRGVIKACIEREIPYLTVFAFSSENWRRPAEEVSYLMQLFTGALEQEITKLHENQIRFKVIGDLSKFEPKIIEFIRAGEQLTAENKRLTFTIAANYGGRWDIMQAMRKMMTQSAELPLNFDEENLARYLSLNYAPEPDLFIRTGGECRISNFLLWQLAYTELYFTDTLWPDFNEHELELAIQSYQQRERRFGRTSEQTRTAMSAKG